MRHHSRVILFSSLIVVLGAASAQAQLPAEDHVAEFGVMFWKPSSPVLTLSTDALTGAGVEEVNFVQDFGIEDRYFPEFRATVGRNHKFRASFVTFDYDADTVITRTIVYNGRVLTIGAPATADIKWNLYKFGYQWDFVSRERGFVGFIADLKYNKMVASIDSPFLSSAASTDSTTPVPGIGVIGRGYLVPNVSVTAEFTGMNISWGEDEVKFLDFDVYGTVSAGRNFGVQGGYRSVDVDYLVDENSGVLKMKGFYFGAVARF